jgi:pimeloyl-ACP methyl ester carboxylesterase
MKSSNPEIGSSIEALGLATNYHEQGDGSPVILLHGSGPGVTAWANWRGIIPQLSKNFRIIAPDIVGFGYTERPQAEDYSLDLWCNHILDFMSGMKLDKVSLVGNSFGGALALALAIRAPESIDRLVLMGAVGTKFELTPGLDMAWGYQPGPGNMRALLEKFAHNHALLSDELVQSRYEASVRPGVQESFSRMFPAPRQDGIDMLAQSDDALSALPHKTLIVHGRHDQIIPVANAYRFHELIPNSDLHIFGRCGHWTQIEKASEFSTLVIGFLSG